MKIERIQTDTIPVVGERVRRDQRGTLSEEAVRFRDDDKGKSGQKGHENGSETPDKGAHPGSAERKDEESRSSDHLHIIA